MTTRANEHGQTVGPALDGWTARRRPDPDVLSGTSVRVERLTPAHLPSLFENTCGPENDAAWTYMFAGPHADLSALRAYVDPMLESSSWAPVALVDPATGDATGMAAYLRIDAEMGTVEVGSVMFGPRLARTRAATEAMYLMARHVIDDLGYRRYEWKCDSLNGASRRAAQRLGFGYEGTWRNAVVYKGRSRDTAWFAMTDADWERLRPAYDVWLAGATGRGQRTSLSALTRPLLRAVDPG